MNKLHKFHNICRPNCKNKRCFKVKKNIATIQCDGKSVNTNKVSVILYTPSIKIDSCYNYRCCKFIRKGYFYHLHFYYSKFIIYNENDFFLHNTTINVGLSNGINYVKGTLKINDKNVDDTIPIVIERMSPHEVLTISFITFSSVLNSDINRFVEKVKISSCFLGFSIIPKYFNSAKCLYIRY